MACPLNLGQVYRQELSYRKQIVRQLHTQHVVGINSKHVTWKSRLRVTQGQVVDKTSMVGPPRGEETMTSY